MYPKLANSSNEAPYNRFLVRVPTERASAAALVWEDTKRLVGW
jgi:hypothetical protein